MPRTFGLISEPIEGGRWKRDGEEVEGVMKVDDCYHPFFSPTMDLAKRAGRGFELNNPR